MKLPKRWLALLLLLALTVVPVLLLTSETTLRWATTFLVEWVPGLELEGVSGRLSSGVSIERMVWRHEDGTHITVSHLRASWRTGPLFAGHLRMHELVIEDVLIHLPDEDSNGHGAAVTKHPVPDLPLAITLHDLRVSSIRLRIDTETSLALETLSARRLAWRGTDLRLRHLDSRWRVALESIAPMQGALVVGDASPRGMDVVVITEDRAVALSGRLLDPFGNPRIEGTLQIEETAFRAWLPGGPGMGIAAEVELSGGRGSLAVRGTLGLVVPEIPRMQVALDARWGASLVVLGLSRVTFRGFGTVATLQGRYEWSDPIEEGRLRVEWEGMDWPVRSDRGQADLRLEGGSLTIGAIGQAGEDDGGRVQLTARLPWPLDSDMVGQADVSWTSLRQGALDSPQGVVTALGSFSSWSVDLQRVAGRLHEQEFTLTGSVAGHEVHAQRVDVEVAVGDARAKVQGVIDERLDLAWQARVPDLAVLSPGATGFLEGIGTVRGSLSDPDLDFRIDGRSIRWNKIALARLSGQGRVQLREGGRTDAALRVEGIEAGGWAVDIATARMNGPVEHLELEFEAVADRIRATLGLSGAWQEGVFAGTLRQATLALGDESAWRLHAPAPLRLASNAVDLKDACWNIPERPTEVCLQGTWSGGSGLTASTRIAHLPLQDLEPWLPLAFIYEGMVQGEAGLDWRAGAEPTAQLALFISQGAWKQTTADGIVPIIAWNSVTVTGQLAEGNLDGTLQFALADGGELDAALRLPLVDTAAGARDERPLQAQLRGAFTDLDLVPALLPDVGSLSGAVRADLSMDGTLNNPRFRGGIEIMDGVMTLPRIGLRLTEMEFELDGGRELLAMRAQVRSGEGLLSATGLFAIRDGRLLGEIRLDGENVQAMNIPEARVDIAPRILITIEGHTLRVEGDMNIPFARIAPRDVAGAVRRSADEVLIDAPPAAESGEEWRVFSRIRLRVGDARFDGFGVTGRVTGALTLLDEPGRETTAIGELQIEDGRYAAWGQQLAVERGRLVFTGGPLAQPGLDIRAVRRPRDVMVGVNVRGTLQEPELRLISEPPMQQAELLSWLVLGMPLVQATGADQQLLDRTARTASLAGGELLARELGRRFGVSEVGIEHGLEPDQAALVIGHYFSPRVYVAYGIGLFDTMNSLRVRFHLNRQWSIEAQTSEQASSTDLKYTIER